MELFASRNFEQILQRNAETSQPPSLSCCCGNYDCVRIKTVDRAFRSMENDARLAAEVGQVLLQKQEAYARGAAERKNYEEELLQTCDELERTNSMMKTRMNKLEWERENAQKTIDMLQAELQVAQENSARLASRLETQAQALKKLAQREKMLAAKTEVEDDLRGQVEDLKHELTIVRKSESQLRIKHNKLRLKHENLQLTHETLSRHHDESFSRCGVEKDMLNQIKNLHERITQYDNLKITVPYNQWQSTPTVGLCLYTDAPAIRDCPSPPLSSKEQIIGYERSPCLSEMSDVDQTCPYATLQTLTWQTFLRLCATDARALNRQLKRAFDMTELSEMSNTIITHILEEVSQHSQQFAWVHHKPEMLHASNVQPFFAMVDTTQQLLQEIGTLRLSLNDLQVDYVNRMERLTQQVAISVVPDGDDHARTWMSRLWDKKFHYSTMKRTSKVEPSQKPCSDGDVKNSTGLWSYLF